MEGESNTAKSHWTGVWCAVALILLLIGYPLSIGPFAWLLHHGYLPKHYGSIALGSVYWPINWAYENIEWYNRAHGWYLTLWGI